MIKSKLIRILKTLTHNELEKLLDFVESPYFNKKPIIGALVKELTNAYPDFDEKSITKESLFQKIYPNEVVDPKRIGYLASDLTKLVLKFLKLERHSTQKDLTLAGVLAEKKLDRLFQKEIQSIQQGYEETNLNGAKRYKNNFELHDLNDRYFINSNQRKDDVNAHLACENLDLFYVCRKLQYFLVLLNRKQIFGKDKDIPHLKFMLEYAKTHFLNNPIVKAYYEVILMQTEEKPLPHFFNLKSTIKDHKHTFSSDELGEIYEKAINFCIKRISFDQAFYVGEALQLYMEFLDSGYMYQNGYLSHWKFKNIIKLGLLRERYDFVEQFIHKYIDKIADEHKLIALNYNLAELNFAMQDFESAQEYLSVLFQEDLELAYILGSRMMLIKIFYQNNEEEAMLSQIAAFAIYLKRSKNISNTKKKIYLNFCDILNKILRQNEKHYIKIKQEIKQTKLLTDTNWLLKVYEELMPPSLIESNNTLNEVI